MATSCLAVAALLAGPVATWGLDVQLAATTQGVLTTTEQTASSTVTSAETTVQATVPAPVVQPTAPSQVQSTAGAVTAAPKRTTAPARSKTSVPPKTLPHQAPRSTPKSLRQAAPEPPLTARRRSLTRVNAKSRPRTSTSRRTRSTARQSDSQCDGFGVLGLVPGGSELGSVLSLVCSAGNLLPPGRIGIANTSGPGVSLGEVLGALFAAGHPAHARAAVLHQNAPALAGDSRATTGAGQPGGPLAVAGQSGSPSPLIYSSVAGAQPGTPAGTLPTANAASHRHHGVFRSPVNATQALSLVLLVDSFLLAAIVMWRAARHWVIPRFA